MFKIIAFGFFLFTSLHVIGQEDMNSRQIEDSTYAYYQSQQYIPLLVMGNKAIEKGIDYYYLRLRLAAAEEAQGRLKMAAYHLQKAAFNNPYESYVRTQMAYNLYYQGKQEELHLTQSYMNKETQQALRYKPIVPCVFVYGESGIKLSNDQSTAGNLTYATVGFMSYMAKNQNWYNSFSIMSQSIYWANIRQWEYYTKYSFLAAEDSKWVGALHYLHSAYTETAINKDTSFGSLVGSLGYYKTFKNWEWSGAFAIGKMNNQKVWQATFGFKYFPFSDNRFQVGVDMMAHHNSTDLKMMYKPNASLQVDDRLWITASYFSIHRRNFMESDAYAANNSADATNSRLDLMATWVLNNHLSVYGVYQHEQKEEYFFAIPYAFNTLIFGLKYTLH